MKSPCVGCTRQFFTKSPRGDGAAVLARSSGEVERAVQKAAGNPKVMAAVQDVMQNGPGAMKSRTTARWGHPHELSERPFNDAYFRSSQPRMRRRSRDGQPSATIFNKQAEGVTVSRARRPCLRGGMVRLDLVPSGELLLVVQALVVVLLGLRAAMTSTARSVRRARTRGRAGTQVNLSSVFFMHSLKVWKNL